MHELKDIVRQVSDPHFAQLLNRLREGNQTKEDIKDIKKPWSILMFLLGRRIMSDFI